ncbi:MAG TPA: hypothetical protein VIL74_10055 [Pyrinomonadaceae bacterium]|jgi:hypothetical protein
MTEDIKDKDENTTVEKLESVGQIIMGEMERIGGILTADPVSQTEGMLTEDAGSVRYETADDIEEAAEEAPRESTEPTE